MWGNFKNSLFVIIATAILSIQGCDVVSKSDDGNSTQPFSQAEIKSGGATTVYQSDDKAYSNPAPNLTPEELERHLEGDVNFEETFVTAPAEVSGGIGPLFNNVSCESCHVNDGRGQPFLTNGEISAVLVRLSKDGDKPGAAKPVEGFGTQLQNHAVFGKQPEGSFKVTYLDSIVTLADGTEVTLRRPSYQVINPYKTLPQNTSFSVRIAPSVFGVGLLEAIPAAQIKSNADSDDRNGDGISGKVNMVYDDFTKSVQLGRFGWKANQPTVRQQIAIAYQQDMGISSPYYPEDNPYNNPEAVDSLDDDPEISQKKLENTVFYMATLAVPAKRNTDSKEVALGKKLFTRAGCQSCHISTFTTKSNAEIKALANQTIHPYTDLLLHDMGNGLADHRSDFNANGREWRTAPLWGLGLVEVVNGHTNLLHDGRARSIVEAILWHGGEAKKSQEFVKELSKSARDALVAFVKAI